MTRIYLGLGTNLGDRPVNLELARRQLADAASLDQCSRIYESEPVGFQAQPFFLNQVVAGETALPPTELLARLKRVEAEMGRLPSFRNGPRPIDLDLLYYGDWVYGGDGLVIPHPHLTERSFVLAPLAEIAPAYRDPLSGESIAAIWARRAAGLARSWIYRG